MSTERRYFSPFEIGVLPMERRESYPSMECWWKMSGGKCLDSRLAQIIECLYEGLKMFESIKYIQSSFSVSFSRQLQIRRSANTFEDFLKSHFSGHYGQPQVISVPDELDSEIPRIIFGSRHGFSQVIVSQINMTLNVTYSPDWQTRAHRVSP